MKSGRVSVEPARSGHSPEESAASLQPRPPGLRVWLAVLSLCLGATTIVTAESLPVGFLPNVADDLHVSLGTAGLMVLIPGLSAAVSAPLALVGAGGIDRRRVIVTLGLLVVLSNGVAAVAPDFAVVLIARVFLGLAIGGFWGVVPPLGFRLAGPVHGSRATSIILAGLSAGTVLGLPAGQILGHVIGWRWTFVVAGAVGLAVVSAQLVLLPRLPAVGRMSFGHLAGVLAVPLGRTGLIAGGVATVGQFAASTFITPLLRDRVHVSAGTATAILLGYGVAGVIGTLISGNLVARSRIWTFVAAAAGFGATLLIIPGVSGTLPAVVGLLIVWGALWGLIPLALQTLMLNALPDAPEAASAMFITVTQLAIAGGAALGGIVVDSSGIGAAFSSAGVVAVVAAVFAAVARRGV